MLITIKHVPVWRKASEDHREARSRKISWTIIVTVIELPTVSDSPDRNQLYVYRNQVHEVRSRFRAVISPSIRSLISETANLRACNERHRSLRILSRADRASFTSFVARDQRQGIKSRFERDLFWVEKEKDQRRGVPSRNSLAYLPPFYISIDIVRL